MLLTKEEFREIGRAWVARLDQNRERKRGDCHRVEGNPSCCSSCHDPGRDDTDLQDVEVAGLGTLRLCCHAARFVRLRPAHTSGRCGGDSATT